MQESLRPFRAKNVLGQKVYRNVTFNNEQLLERKNNLCRLTVLTVLFRQVYCQLFYENVD